MKTIKKNAFLKCKKLKTVDLSKSTSLKTIEEMAFSHCSEITKITLPARNVSVKANAFYGSFKISHVRCLSKTGSFHLGSFHNPSKIKVCCPKNSAAERFFQWQKARVCYSTTKLNVSKMTLCTGWNSSVGFYDTSGKIPYKSSNFKVATVSKSGVIKTKKPGKTTISVKKNGKIYRCKVTVLKQTEDNVVKMVIDNHINKSMTTYQKVYAIHNWMCNHISYGFPDYKKYKWIRSRDEAEHVAATANGVLLTRKAICEGYALTWQKFMKKLHIPSVMLDGSLQPKPGYVQGHIWNEVKISGKWYFIDVTLDDQQDSKNKGVYVFDDFLISTKRCKKYHIWSEKYYGKKAAKDYKMSELNTDGSIVEYVAE